MRFIYTQKTPQTSVKTLLNNILLTRYTKWMYGSRGEGGSNKKALYQIMFENEEHETSNTSLSQFVVHSTLEVVFRCCTSPYHIIPTYTNICSTNSSIQTLVSITRHTSQMPNDPWQIFARAINTRTKRRRETWIRSPTHHCHELTHSTTTATTPTDCGVSHGQQTTNKWNCRKPNSSSSRTQCNIAECMTLH